MYSAARVNGGDGLLTIAENGEKTKDLAEKHSEKHFAGSAAVKKKCLILVTILI